MSESTRIKQNQVESRRLHHRQPMLALPKEDAETEPRISLLDLANEPAGTRNLAAELPEDADPRLRKRLEVPG